MPNYWCVNFDGKKQLEYGLRKKLWLMQYQYEDDYGNLHQGGPRRNATTRNWRQMKNVRIGDIFVAYLKKEQFFAIGRVIAPRRGMAQSDQDGDIEEYVTKKRSHDIRAGRVLYTDVFYEDFDDKWRNKRDPSAKYAQRIDVDDWKQAVPEGVFIPGILGASGDFSGMEKVPVYQIQNACFPLSKEQFDVINSRLKKEHRVGPSKGLHSGSRSDASDKAPTHSKDARDADGVGSDLEEIWKSNESTTVKSRLIEARIGQGAFRKSVLKKWGSACAVTGVTAAEAIRASHIQPWRESDNKDRLDPSNGIPLVATLDALFDRGVISFATNGKMLISHRLSDADRESLGLVEAPSIDLKNKEKTAAFLAKHRVAHGFD